MSSPTRPTPLRSAEPRTAAPTFAAILATTLRGARKLLFGRRRRTSLIDEQPTVAVQLAYSKARWVAFVSLGLFALISVSVFVHPVPPAVVLAGALIAALFAWQFIQAVARVERMASQRQDRPPTEPRPSAN